ncbi:MAG: zinc ribbon domain-containing protein [Polyangiaceae bacterium]|nr:zinc ribbon domain-containing protein [Polyangiaceae bacterium]
MHCPECGKKANPGAAACVACGHLLPAIEAGANASGLLIGRTMVGVAAPGAAAPPVPAPLAEDSAIAGVGPASGGAQRTNVGLSDDATTVKIPSQLQRTILGGVVPPALREGKPPTSPPKAPDGTLLGVAGPGIGSNRVRDPGPPREMPHELGATIVPAQPAKPRRANRVGAERLDPDALLVNRDKLARKRIVLPPVRSREEQARAEAQKRRRKALPFVVGALFVLAFVVAFAIFWRSPAPVSARVRVTPDGHEAVEIECASCPDGTKVSIGDSSAVVSKHVAQIPLVAPLALGENRLSVSLDRPARGRDETVGVSVHVGYHLRPDLSKLTADKPTIHVTIEAVAGTEITIAGNVVKLSDGPKAHAIDVAADCTGSSDEPATLRKRIPYVVKSPDGARTEGVVDVAVGIVPLRIDAPGPRVVTESDTFVLSGQAMKGAEVLVAGRPIQIGADGAFAQRMSVSSIGATNIEVRAKVPGMAPRLVPISVQRVERIELAAKEFEKEKPVGYTTVALASTSDVGRPAIVAGQIAEVRTQNHQTIYLLDVPAKEGCSKTSESCRVRLVHGAAAAAKVGDSITAYGQIGRPWSAPGGLAVPEIQVAFTLPAASRASP